MTQLMLYKHTFAKDGSTSQIARNLFGAANFIISKCCPNIWDGRDEERRVRFSQPILLENCVKALRLAVTEFDSTDWDKTKAGLCCMHLDLKNDKSFPEVLVVSTMKWIKENVQGYRISLILYT